MRGNRATLPNLVEMAAHIKCTDLIRTSCTGSCRDSACGACSDAACKALSSISGVCIQPGDASEALSSLAAMHHTTRCAAEMLCKHSRFADSDNLGLKNAADASSIVTEAAPHL